MELSNIPVIRVNRHPILLDHDTQVVLEAKPGESLYAFLHRNVEDVTNLEVSIDGRVVDSMEWMSRNVTSGQEIVIRTTVHRAALYIVAMVALIYFTGGAAAAVAGGTSFGGIVTAGAIAGMSTAASMAAIGAVQIVGAMLINKVLGPKVPKPTSVERGSVYNIAAARNSARQWEPAGILFGSVQVTPDFAAKPFNRYIGNDQYMQMLLTPGINVARFHTLYFGDSPLSNFQGVTVKKRGFSDMPDDELTSTTNVDTIAGGTLEANVPVIRTTPLGTGSIQVDISYLLFDLTTKGKKKNNQETVVVQVRKVGTTPWVTAGTYNLVNKEQTEQRRSFYHNVEEGQYEVSVRRLGLDTDGSGATCEFTLVSIAAYQVEQNNFDGVAVIQIDMKGTGQLNGAPDEVKAVMDAGALELWDGVQWKTVTEPGANGTSNPGAQVLKYARGFYDDAGNLIAGMGLDDDMIDIEALKALMVHCTENNIQYNMWVQDDRNHGEFLDAIMYPALGRVTMAPGRLTPIWAREEQGTSGIVNMGTIKKGEFQVNYTLVSAADGVEFTYIDRNTWETATLRVPAPGVDVMLNPATISGEGIIDEAQAAMQARYHLGQTLYQAKDIVYSTNMQFLTYMEGDLLHMQHDITQWGFGGRLIDIENTGGTVTITVDDMVPGRDMRDAWVGLCIPGETGFRLFRVQPFAGESDTLTLLDPWPEDAEFPQNIGNKAIHDTTWIYDFKATPGALVRVVGMTPDDELKGASVSVVPESPNFWNFVKNGEYIPPNNESLLNVKPIASALTVGENVVEQGNTVFTELQALWSITNNSARNVVTCGLVGEEPQIVAETTGLSAKWRIDEPGAYVVTVRPYAESGTPGVAVTTTYNTVDTALPPVLVDIFSVEEQSGGVRLYSWGWLADTMQSPDFAGVEIRYIAGSVPVPDWEAMTPLGESGYYTAPFESVLPPAGEWTISARSRNTAGQLSDDLRTITRTFGPNLGEIIAGLDPEDVTQQLIDLQLQIEQERLDRFNADAQEAIDRAAGLAAEALDRQQQINNERTARELAVAAERVRIDAIDDDEIISQVEKPQLRIDYAALMDERAGINTEADLSEVVGEKDAYNEALDRLITYMGTLVYPTRWDDTSGNTNLT